MKQTRVIPVSIDTRKASHHPPAYPTPEALTEALAVHKYHMTPGKTLKGGTVSQVYESVMEGEPVIIKHTEDLIPYDPTELSIGKEGHNTDAHVLSLLKDAEMIRVPHVIAHIPSMTTTIMEDLRTAGFTLMQDRILDRALPEQSAKNIGSMLARLAQTSRSWKPFPTNEHATGSIYERGLELRLAYPNTQKEYLDLETEFTKPAHWVWPDGHPKNMFVNAHGEPAFIDFGRSHWGDQRYILPNFLAHIVIYSLAGYIAPGAAKTYITGCVGAFGKLEPVDEDLFCRYLAMEVLHRSYGKWIAGIETADQKTALVRFGLSVFDNDITKLVDLVSML